MPIHDEIGTRMKKYYEEIPKTRLMRRCPVIIRLDMRAGHSYTKGFKRPFDDIFIKSMQDTAKYLCQNVQGAVMSYQQSDEISLLLIDYQTLNSQAFFDYEVQKVCSITASMATLAFNEAFEKNVYNLMHKTTENNQDDSDEYKEALLKAMTKGAMFDSRCFNLVKEECANYFYWRQLDATRNSIQMVGQANFSHKELQGKSCNAIQDMLHEQRGINWNDLPTYQKRGSCCIKIEELADGAIKELGDGSGVYNEGDVIRRRWVIDNDIPIFTGDCRQYIERFI